MSATDSAAFNANPSAGQSITERQSSGIRDTERTFAGITSNGNGLSSDARSYQRVAEPCGSASYNLTGIPRIHAAMHRYTAEVVFAQPPFLFAIAIRNHTTILSRGDVTIAQGQHECKLTIQR